MKSIKYQFYYRIFILLLCGLLAYLLSQFLIDKIVANQLTRTQINNAVIGIIILCLGIIYILLNNIKRNSLKNNLILLNNEKNEINFQQITSTINDTFYLYNILEKKYEFISENSLDVLGIHNSYFYKGENNTNIIIHQDDITSYKESTIKVNNGESYDIEYRILKNGEWCWIKERSYPIKNNKGQVIRNSGICSDITLKKKQENEIRLSNENSILLSEIGFQITDEISLIKIIEKIHQSVNKLMEADCFGIGIINHQKNEIIFPRFIEKNTFEDNLTYSLDSNILSSICIKKDVNIIINDTEKELIKYTDQKVDLIIGEKPLSVIYLPLKIKNKIIGVITVQSFNRNAYSDKHIKLLDNLAIYIRSAISKAQIHENVEQEVIARTSELVSKSNELEISYKNIKLLSEIGYQISSSMNIGEIFESLYKNVNKLLNAEVFGIRILNKIEHYTEYTYEIENGEKKEPLRISMDNKNNYTVWCLLNNKEIFINDNFKEYTNYVEEIKTPQGKTPHSLMFYPLVNDVEVIGVITVQSFKKNAYKLHDLNILKTLAAYTSSALANAKLYHSLENKVKERTDELSAKNHEITESINYAKRIQDSTLTSDEERKKILPDSFVIYKPKDIVSGDFYRFDTVKTNDGDSLAGFIVGDCTGHGVPGASLALLCSSLLQQSLSNNQINTTGESLDNVREKLTSLFNNNNKVDQIYDGMDVGFGVIHRKTNRLYYSGAILDCIIVRNKEIILIKGDRQHVGYSLSPVPFKTNTFELQKNDCIYIITDGIIDQFGGPRQKKFMMKNLEKLIIEASELPIDQQKDLFSSNLEEWQGNTEQTDDISMIGIKY